MIIKKLKPLKVIIKRDMNHRDLIKRAIQLKFPNLLNAEIIHVGSGTYADAYKVGNLCFKVTGDYHDASMSFKCMGQELKSIVKIHDVFDIDKHISESYLIVSDMLNELRANSILRREGNNIGYDIRDHFRDRKTNRKEFITKLREYRLTDKAIRQLVQMVKEVKRMGFKSLDFHHDNVRVNNKGVLQMIDLGHYTSNTDEDLAIKILN